jgi:SAM-dependent methyltransferase
MKAAALDSVDRYGEIRRTIRRKVGLERFYRDAYHRFARCLERCPGPGTVLELGSGAGFLKEVIPQALTSDFLAYPGVDRQVDARALPFTDGGLRAIFLLDVFHHIPDVAAFLREVRRCLRPQGRLFMVEPYPGWTGRLVYRFLHHEPFHPRAAQWEFASSGPLSGANSALPWIVFERDRSRFERDFPELRLEPVRVHSPLQYWLSGGLHRWSLVPRAAVGAVTRLDSVLSGVWPRCGSFADIELVRLAVR